MKDYAEYEHTSKSGRPFSNSTDWEIWSHNICQGAGNPGRRCVNDDDDSDTGGCPLILLMIVDRTPAEWTGPYARYTCSEKTTATDARRLETERRRTEIADSHYPLFPEVS